MMPISLNGMIHNRFSSQAQMADAMGWSRQRLNRILNGKKSPDLFEVLEISRALGVPFMTVAQFFLPKASPFGDPLA